MSVYFSDRLKLASGFDPTAFANGAQVVVSSPKTKYPEEKVDDALVEKAEVKISLRQKAGGHQTLAFSPPASARVEMVSAGPKPGTKSGKTFLLELALPEGTDGGQVLYLHAADPIMAKPPVVDAVRDSAEGTRRLEVVAVGQLWAVKLRSDVDLREPLEVVFYSRTAGDLPPGFVSWVGRGIPDAATLPLLF